MPPFIPKRRLNQTPPPSSTPPAKRARLQGAAESKPKQRPAPPVSKSGFSIDASDSSLSDVNSDEFEDVPSAVKQAQGEADFDSDEDVDWEDTTAPEPAAHAPLPTENISITINKEDDYIDYGASSKSSKKGPSKREKAVRMQTHQMHVQFLLYHNLLRNSWACDTGVQKILLEQLPSPIRKEVDKWKRASGLADSHEHTATSQGRKRGKKGRDERDWGQPSSRLEPRAADMSRGDPLISLLKVLSAYWKKRFAITAPGLRKRGYSTKLDLRRHLDSYRRGLHDPELHGEVIRNIDDFRALAKKSQGSRDVGAQLFTALLRGLGIEARLIASLQPSGHGWTKAEQMPPRNNAITTQQQDSWRSSDNEATTPASKGKIVKMKAEAAETKSKQPISKRKGQKDTPIELASDIDDESGSDSDSLVDVTPSVPKARRPLYDRDLAFPIYWTEAISPITSRPIPCSPLVLDNSVATTDDYLAAFEPRGAKAEVSKLVMCYVIGYSSDNTAKDLTIRYLRKHIFPGKAKPFRFPIQSIPVYSYSGKIKRYEDYDWFKTVLSPYTRPAHSRTATDDLEDSTDLIPQEPEKKKDDGGVDTLASLKSNPDFVLERHLRREEAVRPGAKPDRMFLSGKEPNLKSEAIYRRSDIERCLTAESWHKEGRRPVHGEVPMKLVPVRAVTLTRKREAEEHERVTGEKQLQGLYSWDQTEYIIPPPIENGVIPKNGYGNIDAFVPSMVPKGAVHLPLKGTVRICKKLEIDYAEAVIGFEFGNKRAVPVIKGVVVAAENERIVRAAWKEYDEAQRKKEETKMERLVLDLWRKFVMGLRIRKEVGEVYGDRGETSRDVLTTNTKGESVEEAIDVDENEDVAGGFEPENNESARDDIFGGGFLLPDEEDQLEHEDLVMEDPPGTQENVGEAAEAVDEADLASEESENDAIPVRSRKGKEKADQYPTPVSMPPSRAKLAMSGKKKSLLQPADDDKDPDQSDSELSSLSASAEPSYPTGADADGISSSQSSSTSSPSEPADSDEVSEPDYLPGPTARHRHRPSRKPATLQQPQSLRGTRSTRSSAMKREPTPDSKIQALSSLNSKNKTKATAIATPTKRGRGRSSQVLTSPYFDGI